jgi:hypothetical protein
MLPPATTCDEIWVDHASLANVVFITLLIRATNCVIHSLFIIFFAVFSPVVPHRHVMSKETVQIYVD